MPPRNEPSSMSEHNKLTNPDSSYGSVGNGSDDTDPTFETDGTTFKPTLVKTQHSFWEDAEQFKEGSIPHSTVVALVIGVVCGVAAYLYYTALFWFLEYVWHTLPQQVVVNKWPEWAYVLWIPLVGFTMAIGVGVTVVFMGEPGDLPYTIKCVHEKAYVAMSHVMPMVCASQFSILGGGSLGPEAPLVAICASLGGYISRRVFRQTNRNLVRKHTLMGMAGALAAFFGCPLGGSLFAMEVNSRFGIEYFEHTVESVFAGEICLVVFRSLTGLPIASIWKITVPTLSSSEPLAVLYGAFLGLIGTVIAILFSKFHFQVMDMFTKLDLLRDERAVHRALLGSSVVILLGMLIPHTMFWGELEFDTISTMSPASTLDHIWPTHGLINFEMDTWWKAFLVGVTKLIAISFTVGGGYRGGYIFPAMASGAAFGRALFYFFPFIPVQLCVLCMAGAINVAITRTSISTTLILAYLSGEQNALSAVLASSLVALFATSYRPFISTQMTRADLDACVYCNEDAAVVEEEDDHGDHV